MGLSMSMREIVKAGSLWVNEIGYDSNFFTRSALRESNQYRLGSLNTSVKYLDPSSHIELDRDKPSSHITHELFLLTWLMASTLVELASYALATACEPRRPPSYERLRVRLSNVQSDKASQVPLPSTNGTRPLERDGSQRRSGHGTIRGW